MLGARYWIHHKVVTATGDSVAGKDEVWVVPSPPSAAVEGTGKFWVVDQAYSVDLSPVFYQFAVSVRCGIFVLKMNKKIKVGQDAHML